MTTALTENAVARMVKAEGKSSDPYFYPTLQALKVMKVSASNANERYRVILSDGTHYVQGMLATQQNHLVKENTLRDFCFIQAKEFMNNIVQGKRVIILLGLEVVGYENAKIGNPSDIEKSDNKAGITAQAPPSAQPMYGNQQYNNNTNTNPVPQNAYSNNNSSNNNNNSRAQPSHSNPYGGSSPAKAPIVRSSDGISQQNYTPISALNMYQNRWTIKARLTSKSDIRYWSNAKGEGSLFSIELLDSSGTDIRATMFKEAVDKFHPMLEIGKVYTLSGGRLKVANMQYNTCKSSYEVTFDQNSEIHLDNDTGEIEQQLFEFVKIANVSDVEPGKNVDLLAVVKSVGAVGTIVSKKSGHELTKCELQLVDDSNAEINLTVWGERATNAANEFANTPIVAFRRVRVSDFGGRSLSSSGSSPVTISPRIPETQALNHWWTDMGGSTANTTKLSSTMGGGAGRISTVEERKTIASIKNENLGHSNPDKPDWINFKATFNWIKTDKDGGAWYTACPNEGEPCKTRYKVAQTADGNYHCERCQGTFPNCVRKFIFSATLTDDSSTTWVSLFDDQARVLLEGISADDVYEKTYAQGDIDSYNAYFDKALFSEWIFTCKVKQEMVQDEMRIKTSVYALHPVDYVKESKELLQAIRKLQ